MNAYWQCFNGIMLREWLRFVLQRTRLLSALVRPLLWLLVFAAGFRAALGIAIINIHPPIVLFGVFLLYGFSGYGVYAWRKAKGQRTSVISTSTDEPEERGLHK